MSYNLEYLNRFAMMLKPEQLDKLTSARIIVFGVGGVGSAVSHFLVRSGIQNFIIVDFENIDITNFNRQLVDYNSNIWKKKVEELAVQLKDINPNLAITAYPIKYTPDTTELDFDSFDIIIDCIDDIKAKQDLILKANKHNKYIISAMGAGNRYKYIPQFEISDISKTSYDPISKILRKFCIQQGIKKLDVCYTKQKAVKFDCKTIASVVYYPISMATVIVASVINRIIG